MDSKIKQVAEKCFPQAFAETSGENDFSEYSSLRTLVNYATKLMHDKKTNKIRELFEMIDNLYHYGNLHERNAIENEFLDPLSKEEKEGTLREHLKLMPKNLKSVYIKTIMEN